MNDSRRETSTSNEQGKRTLSPKILTSLVRVTGKLNLNNSPFSVSSSTTYLNDNRHSFPGGKFPTDTEQVLAVGPKFKSVVHLRVEEQ